VAVLAVIPSRLGATRLPRKPLLELAGRPLVRWVWDAAVGAGVFDEVVVATPDEELADVVTSFGGRAVLTSAEHETGTDRVAEVAAQRDHAVVANVQGDQPFVTHEMLQALVAPFETSDPPLMSTVAAPLRSPAQFADPNTVKIVVDARADALYFSRAPIPHARDGSPPDALQHIGLYAFQREFLATYATLPPGRLEVVEGLEQLRAMEHGVRIRVAEVAAAPIEINTDDDVAAAEAHIASGAAR
jgi:3-deoxy-manno-octulosonate cytidylyltransferase (CMP-KDO synthetase)